MLNKVVLMGRFTRDPELKATTSGTPVLSFTLACDRDFKERDGQTNVDFIDCVVWRHKAQFVYDHFRKGSLAVVEGRLQIREYQDRDGGNKRKAEINVDNIYFGESKRKSDADERPPFPGDADVPPEMDNTPPRDVDKLFSDFPGTVQYADPGGELPWE